MRINAKKLFDLKVQASDGELGKVNDALIDERSWMLRYLVAETGGWLFGRKVLISPVAFSEPDASGGLLPVHMTKDEVKDSPEITVDPPLSRDQETRYHDHYRWPYYWGGGGIPGGGLGYIGVAPEAAFVGDTSVGPDISPLPAEDRDPSLRSAKTLIGYDLAIGQDKVAKIEDVVLDTERWSVAWVVGTLNEGDGQRLLLPVEIVQLQDVDQPVLLDTRQESLSSAPRYDESVEDDAAFYESVSKHYRHET